jgi:hypothetical protein
MMLITLPWLIGACYLLFHSHWEAVVGNRQRVATGVITAYEETNHNQYRYQFAVDGATYTGLSNAPDDVATVNGVAIVYYDPQDPSTNSLQNFVSESERDRGFVPVPLIGIAAVAVVILFIKVNAKNKAFIGKH